METVNVGFGTRCWVLRLTSFLLWLQCFCLRPSLFPLSSYLGIGHIGLRPTLILTWWHLQRPHFQTKAPCGHELRGPASLSHMVPQMTPFSPTLGCFPNFLLPWPPRVVPTKTSVQYHSFRAFPESSWVLKDPEQRIHGKIEDLPWDTPTCRCSPAVDRPCRRLRPPPRPRASGGSRAGLRAFWGPWSYDGSFKTKRHILLLLQKATQSLGYVSRKDRNELNSGDVGKAEQKLLYLRKSNTIYCKFLLEFYQISWKIQWTEYWVIKNGKNKNTWWF